MGKPIKDMSLEEIKQLPKVDCLFIYSKATKKKNDDPDIYKRQLWVVLNPLVSSKPVDLGASASIIATSQRWNDHPKLNEKKKFKLHAELVQGLTKEPGKSVQREWFYKMQLFLHRDSEGTYTLTAWIADEDIPYIRSTTLDDMFELVGTDAANMAKDKVYA